MKAQELRIGNFVWNPVQEIAVRVDLRLLSDILMRQKAKIDIGWEPIPLTEQWLLDFGFDETMLYLSKGNLLFHKQHGLWSWFGNYIVCPKSVHQLQNLYFALTGEELQL